MGTTSVIGKGTVENNANMEKQIKFVVSGTNNKLWNTYELIEYLSSKQNQDIVLTVNPEAIDLKDIGLYKILDSFTFRSVKIYTANVLEQHHKYEIINPWANKWMSDIADINSKLHNWNLEKVFLAMYYRPTANRLGLASHLYTTHPYQSIVHFSYSTDVDSLELFEFEKLAQYDLQSLINLGSLLPKLPIRVFPGHLEEIKKFNYCYDENAGLDIYNKILIDIVSESHVSGVTFYPTEKTARPMWLKKPFIVFSSVNYLEYLRQMGFRTFADFWDESYDGYQGAERYKKILNLIDKLSAKSKAELETMYWDMQYTLDHNYNLLKTQQYKTNISLIE